MRVLLVTWNYPPKVGGMEMMLNQLVQNMLPYIDVHVIGPYVDRNENITQPEKIIRPKRNGLIWFFLFALFSGIRLLRSNSYEVIVAGSTLVAPLVYVLGRLFRVPVALNVYGLDLIYPHPLYQWMVKIFLPKCDYIFAISQASREEAIKRGATADQIQIFSPGVEFSEFETVPRLDGIRRLHDFEKRLVILSAGRLAKRKGVLEFIKYSLPSIVEKCPDVIFLVVGENPTLSLAHKEDLRTQIMAVVNELGLNEYVRLLGRVKRSELVKLYHACDVFVLPAIAVPGDMEGFGIVLLEASAAGKAVVATNLGGISDAVANGESGLLVEAESWPELSTTIADLLVNQLLRRELGQCGRMRVQTEFDWPIIGRRYAENLIRLLGEKR